MNSDAVDRRPDGEIWVFGYGSLMWRPGFPHVAARHAVLHGYHRALCVYSWEYRGTPEKPGLVFGLDRGGSCKGTAFRVAAMDVDETLAYLDERELITNVYQPRWRPVTILDGPNPGPVTAYYFVADPKHDQYAGKLSDEETVRLVIQGCGKSGLCIDYLTNTYAHLEELDIHDEHLARIIRMAQEAAG